MIRISGIVLIGVVLAMSAHAADDQPAGNWKFSFLNQGQMVTPWLLKLEKKGNDWAGSVLASVQGAPPGITVAKASIANDVLRLTLRVQGQDLTFEGKIPKDKDKNILGSFSMGTQMVPAQLEPTKLQTMDTFELFKELVMKGDAGPEAFQGALELLKAASDKKVKLDEARGWANKAFTVAESYGPRWQREMALRMAVSLLPQEAYHPLALEYARKAERLLDPSDSPASQVRVLDVLAEVLHHAKKEDEAKEIETRSDSIYRKQLASFKPDKFAGRKSKSDRAVLVELFTGAQCPPCVAADLACEALAKTYAPAEVVLLEYHLHVPGPDPLTNEDTVARSKYYDDEIEGTPTILFNGKLKPRANEGGSAEDAKDRYQVYQDVINPLLDRTTTAKLKVKAVRKRDKIDISAEAAGVDVDGGKAHLRLALVEDSVRYAGGNSIRFHHHVVRAMPGGAEGVAVKNRTAKQDITVDLNHVRESLNKYLNEFGKQNPFPSTKRPMELQKLYVVALVQNDETKEVLQAIQVPVTME